MKRKRFTFLPGLIPASAAVVLLLSACTGRDSGTAAGQTPAAPVSVVRVAANVAASGAVFPSDMENIPRLLEEIAELERAGALQRGMGFIESELREKVGDYAGAVLAAVREMARSYGYGEIQMNDLVLGLDRTIALEGQGKETAVQAALALRAFFEGRWDEAEQMLAGIFPETEEPDNFISWLLLSCTLEKNRDDKRAGSAYKAIRARYAQFPEYWYRGARVFSGSIASEYAERCINVAPDGPFAPECRSILASSAGLNAEDGASIRSKLEIEGCVTQSVRSGNPELLKPLIPLISLPENPYTLYAIGVLKSLAAVPIYREYFDTLAAGSKGRLADRLVYICRG
jgi:hypothetical protein